MLIRTTFVIESPIMHIKSRKRIKMLLQTSSPFVVNKSKNRTQNQRITEPQRRKLMPFFQGDVLQLIDGIWYAMFEA